MHLFAGKIMLYFGGLPVPLVMLAWLMSGCLESGEGSSEKKDPQAHQDPAHNEAEGSVRAQVASASHTYNLICYYYKLHNDPSEGDKFTAWDGGWIWAKGDNSENVYLQGNFEDGFFVVADIYSAGFVWNKKQYPATRQSVDELCARSIDSLGGGFNLLKSMASSYRNYLFEYSLAFSDSAPRLVVFGDSISDDGNMRNWTRLYPALPYFMGRFSNGPIWTDYLSNMAQSPLQNWAYGGAKTRSYVSPSLTDAILNILTGRYHDITGDTISQAKKYTYNSLVDGKIKHKEKDVFIVWAGANDYQFDDFDLIYYKIDPGAYYFDIHAGFIAYNIGEQIKFLRSIGAKNVMVINLWDFGTSPVAHPPSTYDRGSASYYSETAKSHNRSLENEVLKIKKDDLGINVFYLDIFSAVEKMIGNIPPHEISPEIAFDYGFDFSGVSRIIDGKIFMNSCFNGSWRGSSSPQRDTCSQVSKAFYYDDVHPTTLGHCWFSYFIQQGLYQAGWIPAAPDLKSYQAVCASE